MSRSGHAIRIHISGRSVFVYEFLRASEPHQRDRMCDFLIYDIRLLSGWDPKGPNAPDLDKCERIHIKGMQAIFKCFSDPYFLRVTVQL